MRFGPVPLEEAQGAILAHTQRLPGRVIRKGSILGADAVAALAAAGRTEVIAARLEPGDVPEDEAADRLSTAMLGEAAASPLGRTRAATGRVNLQAEAHGLLRVETGLIDRINAVDESLTIGTLPDYAVVAPRDMVATIKIIPFAVPGPVLEAAEALGRRQGPMMRVHPFRPLTVGLVMSQLDGLKESVLEGTAKATEARVRALTGIMLPPRRCPHAEAPIAAALAALIEDGADLLLVAGASAVVDRRDVGPAAIVRAGGEILHFGMPVDPGNLICLGRIGDRPALILPGCARSPRLNGIDFVLSRLFAGMPLGPADMARLGVGGLLKEIETRPLPRARAPDAARAVAAPRPRKRPGVAAVVLGAGRSSRMAPRNKLLIPDESGRPMIARVVDNVLGSAARPVIVVLGHMAEAVEQALAGRSLRFVHAADFADGLSASLKAGIRAVPPDAAAALICLGDMPLVGPRLLERLLAAYDPDEGRTIVLPSYRGKPGNPMLWDRRYFPEILRLGGDAGARALLRRYLDAVAEVEVDDDAVLRDFDTAESLLTLSG